MREVLFISNTITLEVKPSNDKGQKEGLKDPNDPISTSSKFSELNSLNQSNTINHMYWHDQVDMALMTCTKLLLMAISGVKNDDGLKKNANVRKQLYRNQSTPI